MLVSPLRSRGLLMAACGNDSDGDSSSGSQSAASGFEVGDCTTELEGGTAEKVPCDDPSAVYEVDGVISTSLEGSACGEGYEKFEADGDNICLGPITFDLTSLEVGDCTDATSEESEPSTSLPCDDPAATARVVELVDEAPGECTMGDIDYGIISNGVERTICQELL